MSRVDEELERSAAAAEADRKAAAEKAFGADKAQPERSGLSRWMTNLPKNINVGLIDAALNTMDAVDSIGDPKPEATPHEKRMAPSDAVPPMQQLAMAGGQLEQGDLSAVRGATVAFRNLLAQGSKTSDTVTQAASQFVIPFIGWSKAFAGVKAAANAPKLAQTAGKVGQAVGAEAATLATAFDPHEGRLADLVEFGKQTEGRFADVLNTIAPDGSAINAYIDYMTDRGDEGELEGRFKNVIDGLAGSAVVGGLLSVGAKTFRTARNFADSQIVLPEISLKKPSDVVLRNLDDFAEELASIKENDTWGTAERLAKRERDEALHLREGMRAQTRDILDELSADGVSPRDVAKQFWDVTYRALSLEVKTRFERYAGGLGYGSTDEGVEEFFARTLPSDVSRLDRTSGAVVAQMRWMNEQLTGKNIASVIGAPPPDAPSMAPRLPDFEDEFVEMRRRAAAMPPAEQPASGASIASVIGDVPPDAPPLIDRPSNRMAAEAFKLFETDPRAALVHLTEQADDALDDAASAELKDAARIVSERLPKTGISIVPTEQGHTVVVGRQPLLTFLSPEDAQAAIGDVRRQLGAAFETRAAAEHAKASDSNFATLHSFSRVLQTNKDRPVSTHSLLSALEKNLKGDTEQGAFYKELLGRLVRKKLGGTTTVTEKGVKERQAGFYIGETNEIHLRQQAFESPARLLKVYAHEGVHAATVHEMNSSPIVFTRMERLRKTVEKTFQEQEAAAAAPDKGAGFVVDTSTPGGKPLPYGFTNAYEFVAEIESNPEFRQLMQKTKLPGGGTAWDKYLETIAGILGVGSLVATPAGLKEFSKLMMGQKEETSSG